MEDLKWACRLSVAIPASVVVDTPHPREKTFKIGLVGRAAAIFRVDEIVVYPDLPGEDQSRDVRFVSLILSYMETPQYLRKHLFPLDPDLKYAGILPPLRTPHHPTSRHVGDLRLGEFREGVILRSRKRPSHVDIGVERPALLRGSNIGVGTRVTVRVVGFHHKIPEVVLAEPEEIKIYWGYRVTVSSLGLGLLIKGGNYDLVVATSRYGKGLMEIVDDLWERWKSSHRVLVAFGSPNEGLMEILGHENLKLGEVADFTVNTIPMQGTETVRTEEAVYATLAAINLLMRRDKNGSSEKTRP